MPKIYFRLMKYFIILLTVWPVFVSAQDSLPIRDNSFLVEEAFNQEKGVIQHICLLRMNDEFEPQLFSFTQEWPLFSEKHQLSYTLPVSGFNSHSDNPVLENILLNYRYQLVGNEKIFLSPRITAILPGQKRDFHRYSSGVEFNLPLSVPLGKFWIAHVNAGANYITEEILKAGLKTYNRTFTSGLSVIYQPAFNFNLLSEFIYSLESSRFNFNDYNTTSFTWNPGLRAAANFKSGLQIVPGFSVPVEISEGSCEAGFLFYLSFEHLIKKSK